MIGIIGAMEEEVAILKDKIVNLEIKQNISYKWIYIYKETINRPMFIWLHVLTPAIRDF